MRTWFYFFYETIHWSSGEHLGFSFNLDVSRDEVKGKHRNWKTKITKLFPKGQVINTYFDLLHAHKPCFLILLPLSFLFLGLFTVAAVKSWVVDKPWKWDPDKSQVSLMDHFTTIFAPKAITFFILVRQNAVDIQKRLLCG